MRSPHLLKKGQRPKVKSSQLRFSLDNVDSRLVLKYDMILAHVEWIKWDIIKDLILAAMLKSDDAINSNHHHITKHYTTLCNSVSRIQYAAMISWSRGRVI